MNRDLFEEFLDHCDEIFCVSSRPSPQVIRPRTKLLEHGFARKLKTSLSDEWDHVGIPALCLEELQGKVDWYSGGNRWSSRPTPFVCSAEDLVQPPIRTHPVTKGSDSSRVP